MTDPDLTEAIREAWKLVDPASTLSTDDAELVQDAIVATVVVVERRVRENIASQLDAEMATAWPPGTTVDPRRMGKFQAYENASRIARGGAA